MRLAVGRSASRLYGVFLEREQEVVRAAVIIGQYCSVAFQMTHPGMLSPDFRDFGRIHSHPENFSLFASRADLKSGCILCE